MKRTVIHADVDGEQVVGTVGNVDHAHEQRRRVELRPEGKTERGTPLHVEGVEHAVVVIVERVVRDRRHERVAAQIDPLTVEVHDLADRDQVLLRVQVARLATGENRLLIAVRLLPVRRGPRLGDQQHRGGGVGRLRQVADHELHRSGVAVVVNPAEQLVLAGDRGGDDAPRGVLRAGHGHRRQGDRRGTEIDVLPSDAGRRGDRERRGLVADLAHRETQLAGRSGHAIAACIVGEHRPPRLEHANADKPKRGAGQRVVDGADDHRAVGRCGPGWLLSTALPNGGDENRSYKREKPEQAPIDLYRRSTRDTG